MTTKALPYCPNCNQPTIMHCPSNENCDWWRCTGCMSFGQEKRWWDAANKKHHNESP